MIGSVVRRRTALTRVHVRAYTTHVDVEWDPVNAASNLGKHGISFADAATALHDEHALTILDDEADEERYVTVAMDALGRAVVVVFAWRGTSVRLISARKAT